MIPSGQTRSTWAIYHKDFISDERCRCGSGWFYNAIAGQIILRGCVEIVIGESHYL